MSIGKRIKSARIIAGSSQRDLANRAEVSAMAISKYERDMDTPGSAVLLRLADALSVNIEYFFRPTTVTFSSPTYRKRASLPALEDASILERIQEWLERYLDIESLLNRASTFTLPPPQRIEIMEEIESAALALRKQWCLGLDPIENLMEVCEDHGIKIGLVDGHPDFDAVTLQANDTIPVIALRRDMPGDRQRFCLAHELGHLILQPIEHIDAEKAAHRFAGALLAPCSTVELELGTKRHTIGLNELYLLKCKYGLSMQAWIYRAKDLNILSETDAIQLFKYFRQRGWNRKEPGNPLSSEIPQRFERLVMHALCEDIISQTRAAELLAMPLEQFLGGDVERYGGFSIDMCS
ncbi:MAG: ImmA/IrrE family metallo-endopeptidase [Ktedonobacteraceae bacterium]|nr:ImmA/IrrE family metallo-endopeptidase [Ktedonobacteraceae bacterium]